MLYLVGEAPFFERPDCDYVIAQDIYHPPFEVDAFLPAASFAEAGGTLTNVEGRVQEIVRIEDLPDGAIAGFARPDWFIFGALAERLAVEGLAYRARGDVLKEIAEKVPSFPSSPDRQARRLELRGDLSRGRTTEPRAPVRGGASSWSPEGFATAGATSAPSWRALVSSGWREGSLSTRKISLSWASGSGDSVVVRVGSLEIPGPAKADPECPREP